MTAAEIVSVQSAQLEQLAPASREAAVTAYLSHARDQLALAVQASGPEAVAALKAQIATAAEATKQLNMSKEIQQDAQEMVRRCEYALAKAIRKGQEEGTVMAHGVGGNHVRGKGVHGTGLVASPSDFASDVELYDRPSQGKAGILSFADNATPEEFDAALTEARSEGNLSRANVARKIKGETPSSTGSTRTYLTTEERVEQIRRLAPNGMTSGQIAKEIGVGEEYVRKLARENGIEITADNVLRGTRRHIDSNRIVQETVTGLEGMITGLRLINFADLDRDQISHWSNSLTESLRALNRLSRQIKEMDQ